MSRKSGVASGVAHDARKLDPSQGKNFSVGVSLSLSLSLYIYIICVYTHIRIDTHIFLGGGSTGRSRLEGAAVWRFFISHLRAW